jgi:restriction system protein
MAIAIAILKEMDKNNRKKNRYKQKKQNNYEPKNKPINQTINQIKYQEKVEKGASYEEFIANILRNRNYEVYEKGKYDGRKDGGIDIIASKLNILMFVQCKNWKQNSRYKITHRDIKSFKTEVNDYILKNSISNMYYIEMKYIVSNDILDYSAKKYIQENEKMSYEIIQIQKDEYQNDT